MDTWDLYVGQNFNDKGTHVNSCNLTAEQELGRKEIQEGIKNNQWKLYGTDKSGKLVLDTVENFNNSMKTHYESELRTSMAEVRKSESVLNNHSRSWAKILSLGRECNQEDRISRALMVFDSNIPAMQGLRKDHKGGYDPFLGPA